LGERAEPVSLSLEKMLSARLLLIPEMIALTLDLIFAHELSADSI
jgi:hypothetical protein